MHRQVEAAMEQLEQEGYYSDDDLQLNEDEVAEDIEDQEAVLPANAVEPIIIALVDSQKGNQKAEYMGYLFIKHKLSKPTGDKQYWQCDKYKPADGGCKARLHTRVANNSFIKIMGQHNHEVDPAAVRVAQIKSNVRSMAAQSQDKPIQIFTNVLQNIPMLVSEKLKKSAVRKQAKRRINYQTYTLFDDETKNIQTLVIELDESTEESIDDGGDLNSSDIVCTYQEDSSFIIDTEQCEEQENSAFMSSEAGSTLNMSNICSHLTPEVKKTKKGPACFNCQGEHQLIECTEPRDNRRISRNRSSFRSNQGGPRIHEQLDSTKKSFVPGVISDSLREALGLRKNEMPEWIFRMRVKGFIDGYPPAYLKRAVEKSTLEFFATDQVAGVDDVKGMEKIDPDKMIRYRGFNIEDKKLNDPERFRIPPWKDFVAAHQHELDKRNNMRRMVEERRAAMNNAHPPLSKKMRRSNASMEEGEILDESVIELTDETACEDGEGVLNATSSNGNTNGDQDDGAQSSSAAGPAISKGTPILMSSTICSGQFNHEVVKPKLESWSHDILPFQHQNIVEETGFFKKMLSIVKGSRKKL